MSKEKQVESQLSTGQPSMQQRFPARRRSLPGMLWSARTLLEKKRIAWEDQRDLFRYETWIRRVEMRGLQGMVRKAAGLPAVEQLEFVICGGELSQAGLEATLRSLRPLRSPWLLTMYMELRSELADAPWLVEMLAADSHLQLIPKESAAEIFYLPRFASESGADWLVPLRCGDCLSQHWENAFLIHTQESRAADLVYWDEDQVAAGRREKPLFKPGWSPELMFSLNYLESAAFRRDFLLRLMDRGEAVDGSWIFDLVSENAQVEHIPHVLQHRAKVSAQTASRLQREHEAAVQSALERLGCARVRVTRSGDGELCAGWDPSPALVSIVIPTRDHPEMITRCLRTLLEKTRGVDYEVIVMDDHSSDPEVLAFYEEVQSRYSQVCVHSNDGPFNYSRVNNQGGRLAKGDLILFLNNDVEILHENWLAEMVCWAQMPGVGMVGAKLLYPTGEIQHAGIVLGMTGHAGHLFAGQPPLYSTLFLSSRVYRNVSAVTGACMLVRRAAFEQVGGFDENLMLVFNDVDLGVRFLQQGWRIVYTPGAELIHYEGVSRSRYMPPEDIRLGAKQLIAEISRGDRCYSPNLSLSVNWPSFRRPYEASAADRLRHIVQWKG